ncbi:hypothetical protein AVEN_138461-1 [Araneus ventricosus]|uniref:Uncharacterized protein n=1 Tax=Araneus ventricosus TaxID=182803 RepID=A0A4Y2CDN2_ARAVE|nr:hypothetical protein AVEN_138461-1 [Araneus ventricosus]
MEGAHSNRGPGPRWPSGKVSEPEGSSFETPISLKIRRVLGLLHLGVQMSFCWCDAEAWRGDASSGLFYPRRLTVAQNYEVRLKIALVLLQNGTLIYLN